MIIREPSVLLLGYYLVYMFTCMYIREIIMLFEHNLN